MNMVSFRSGLRVQVAGVRDSLAPLDGMTGTALRPSVDGEAWWVRMDGQLPAALPHWMRRLDDRDPLGRNVCLRPQNCQLAEASAFTSFHRMEFEAMLNDVGRSFRAMSWADATAEMRRHSPRLGLWEYVYRLAIVGQPSMLLVYSSIDTGTDWARPAGGDAVRFVYQRIARGRPPLFLATDHRRNRVDGVLANVKDSIVRLMRVPPFDGAPQWSTDPFERR